MLALAALHIGIAAGGPKWYAFFGAPAGLIRMAERGDLHAPLYCLAIALLLAVCAAYAFSAGGVMPRLPFPRAALTAIAAAFLWRGISFIVFAQIDPAAIRGFCGSCQSLNAFVVTTSAIAVLIGCGCAIGAASVSLLPRSASQDDA